MNRLRADVQFWCQNQQLQTLRVLFTFFFFPLRSCSQSNSNFPQTEDINLFFLTRPPPGLRQLSVSELTETLEEVETAIRRYSEELIQALALRDELDYEKEVLGADLGRLMLKMIFVI